MKYKEIKVAIISAVISTIARIVTGISVDARVIIGVVIFAGLMNYITLLEIKDDIRK